MNNMDERVSFGEVIGGAVGMIRRHPAPAIIYVLLMACLEIAIAVSGNADVSFWPVLLGAVIGGYLVTWQVMARESMVRPGQGWRYVGVYLGITFLAGIGSLLGFAFLILPGLVLLARWSIAVPLAIAADLPTGAAMSRSWELTSKSRWSLVGFYAVYMVGQLMAGGLVFGVQPGPVSLWEMVSSIIASLIEAFGIYASVAILQKLDPDRSSLKAIFA